MGLTGEFISLEEPSDDSDIVSVLDLVADCDAPPFTKGRTPVYLCHSLDQ
jgi:hypothetical protein